VQAEIFESQAPLVKVGQPVTMTLDYLAGKQWLGEVDYVYPTLDPQTRTARVRLRFGNPQALLKPNMFAKVAIQTSANPDVLVIPKEAVIRLGDQDRVVLALGEGRFKSVAVALGRIDGAFAEIRGGLSVGERVVTSAHFLLDSESSKTSDFKRMNHASMKDKTMNHSTMNHSTMKNEPSKGHEMENDND
jgi:Cu(I)/Ag(I) efflux system membrane fusion protein